MLPLGIGVYLGSGGGVFRTMDLSLHGKTYLRSSDASWRLRSRRTVRMMTAAWYALATGPNDVPGALGDRAG
jgi:hypothetical protein